MMKNDTEENKASDSNAFGDRFKQIMQVLSFNITEKLRKLNDKVTEKEAA